MSSVRAQCLRVLHKHRMNERVFGGMHCYSTDCSSIKLFVSEREYVIESEMHTVLPVHNMRAYRGSKDKFHSVAYPEGSEGK